MNGLEVRTNRGEYAGGQTIYGAVYLRAVTPINAEMLQLTISGIESCTWEKTVPVGDDNSSAIEDTCASEQLVVGEAHDEREIQQKDIQFKGEKEEFRAEFNLASFENGAVPLGCFVYPFHYTLQQGLPNSFLRKEQYDEIKNTTYEASIKYQVTAKLFNSTWSSTTGLSAFQNIEVKNLDITANTNRYSWRRSRSSRRQQQHGKYTRSIDAPVKRSVCCACCCHFGKLELNVEMEKIPYSFGETVKLQYCIDNRSNIRLEKANIKLKRILTIHGNNTSEDNDLYSKQTMKLKQTGFPEILKQIDETINIEGRQKKYFDVHIPLTCPINENLSGTLGSLIQCRYNLEVEVEVPSGTDVSVNMPLNVLPQHSKEWLQWNPPEWINNLTLCRVNGICAVANHLLESKEFENVPLPNNTKL